MLMIMTNQVLALFDIEKISKAGEFGIGNALVVSLIGICVVLSELALLAVCINLIGKVLGKFSKKGTAVENTVEADASDSNELPTVGDRKVKLVDVDEKTAAMVMALVAHETEIPLDRLDFKSIKKVD